MQICLYMNKPKQNLQEIKSRQRVKNKTKKTKGTNDTLFEKCTKNAVVEGWGL